MVGEFPWLPSVQFQLYWLTYSPNVDWHWLLFPLESTQS
jgi:hypothetical protein